MGEVTKIQWCDHTFNPWRGCTKVAPGCANCYAETQSKRNPGTLGVWGPNGTRVVAAEPQWAMIKNLNAKAGRLNEAWSEDRAERDIVGAWTGKPPRPRVFVASLADVFEDWQGPMVNSSGNILFDLGDWNWRTAKYINPRAWPGFDLNDPLYRLKMDEVRARLFRLIDDCPNLDFLLVTKRPENIWRMWNPFLMDGTLTQEFDAPRFRKNVWLITSVSDQETADQAIPTLLKCRKLSPVLGISAEPLLGHIDLNHLHYDRMVEIDCLNGTHGLIRPHRGESAKIDWVIVGGESGHGARPCHSNWVRSIVGHCQLAKVPVFVKQLGTRPDGLRFKMDIHGTPYCIENNLMKGSAEPLDRKGGDPQEWPEDLRVREFPVVPA